jgi:hypothetical protein
MAIGSELSSGSGNQVSQTSPGPPFTQDNNWVKHQSDKTPGRAQGTTLKWLGTRHWYIVDYPVPPLSITPSLPNWSYYVTKALAGMNPNRPIVDLPLFIFELKDIPRMLRDAGRIIFRGDIAAKDIPGSYLSFKFGHAPLFSDLQKLLDYGEACESAIARLKRADARNRFSGTLDKYRFSLGSAAGGYNTPYSIAKVHWKQTLYSHRTVWYSAKLSPLYTLPEWDSPIARARWALGLNVSLETIWNAIPWSWLIDYFTNIGSFLAAYRGGMPQGIDSICIMCSDQLEVDGRITFSSGWQEPPTFIMPSNAGHYKRREVFKDPTPKITFKPNPLAGKAGILGSLVLVQLLSAGR